MLRSTSLQQTRRVAAVAVMLLTSLALIWALAPGLPVLWGPTASTALKSEGRQLFLHEWQANDPLAKGDGLGPVFNGKSCVACHFQGGAGGGGLNSANVMGFHVVPTTRDPDGRDGVLHTDAIDVSYRESEKQLRQLFPVIPGGTRVQDGCSYKTPDFDPVITQTLNATALYGAGWIDRISPRSISHYQLQRTLSNVANEFSLDFNSVPAGKVRILPDGRVGKFGWKAQFATLEEFVAAACANELGLGTPVMAQPKPLGRPDYPDVKPDLDRGPFNALTAFVATLPRPIEVTPTDATQRGLADPAKQLFHSVGCTLCHTPNPGGVTGVYSDFLLHEVSSEGPASDGYVVSSAELPRPMGEPTASEWRTPPLWGVADSAPYFHDGRSLTLKDAIARHKGAATRVRSAFEALNGSDQQAIIAFLGTLKAPADAEPVAEE